MALAAHSLRNSGPRAPRVVVIIYSLSGSVHPDIDSETVNSVEAEGKLVNIPHHSPR